MNTWLTVDFIAKRYGYLPSQVLEFGTTMDLQIANLSMSYENWLHEEAEKKAKGGTNSVSSDLSEEQMKAMLNSVRNTDANTRKQNAA